MFPPFAVVGGFRVHGLTPGDGFANIPLGGIMLMQPSDRKSQKIARLNRIAGQVQGVARMVADDRYCMEILHQVQAVKAALARAEAEILRDHAAHCVHQAIVSGDAEATQQKLDELVDLFDRSRR
jgi:CsoR family transcriptional regulator, copper-sensing transcriptional repressor